MASGSFCLAEDGWTEVPTGSSSKTNELKLAGFTKFRWPFDLRWLSVVAIRSDGCLLPRNWRWIHRNSPEGGAIMSHLPSGVWPRDLTGSPLCSVTYFTSFLEEIKLPT